MAAGRRRVCRSLLGDHLLLLFEAPPVPRHPRSAASEPLQPSLVQMQRRASHDQPPAAASRPQPAPAQVALLSLDTMRLVDLFSLPPHLTPPILGIAIGFTGAGADGAYGVGEPGEPGIAPVAGLGVGLLAFGSWGAASGARMPPPSRRPLAGGLIAGVGGSSEGGHAPSRAYIWTADRVACVRGLLVRELVLWLAGRGHYSAAMHMCSQQRRLRVLAEIASAYACELWAAGQPSAALMLWGEYVLPYAPPRYWLAFIARLDAADQLHLIEKVRRRRALVSPPSGVGRRRGCPMCGGRSTCRSTIARCWHRRCTCASSRIACAAVTTSSSSVRRRHRQKAHPPT